MDSDFNDAEAELMDEINGAAQPPITTKSKKHLDDLRRRIRVKTTVDAGDGDELDAIDDELGDIPEDIMTLYMNNMKEVFIYLNI